MRKNISLFIIALLLGTAVVAQECVAYFPLKTGALLEVTNYDAKGKFEGSSRQTILSVDETADGTSIKVKSEIYDKKEKLIIDNELEMICRGETFYMDMKNMFDPSSMGGNQDFEVEYEGVNMEYPAKINVNQQLKDATIKMRLFSSVMPMMPITINIINRKVEAYEKITTPAGVFDCYKISFDIEMKTMFKATAKAAEWVAPGVGVVRSERYDKKGKLQDYSELSGLRL